MHIPDDPQYYEKFYFTPGDLGFRSLGHAVRPDRRAGLLGPVVPRGRPAHGLSGAQILFYPTAIGWLPPEKAEHGAQQQSAWETIQRSHAIANGVFVCAVNRVGHEGDPAGGHRVLGRQLRRRSGRSGPREGRDGRGGAHRDLRPRQGGRAAAPTGRSCATGGSTRTGTSPGGIWIDSGKGDVAKRRGAQPVAARSSPAHLPIWASACPPSGRPTAAPGSAGPTRRPPGPASSSRCPAIFAAHGAASRPTTRKCTSTWPGRTWRPQVRQLLLADEGADAGNVCFHHQPHQRRLVPRPRPDLRAAETASAAARRRSSTGATTPGAASIRPTTSTT